MPPKDVIISEFKSGKRLKLVAGPYEENTNLTLRCEAIAGESMFFYLPFFSFTSLLGHASTDGDVLSILLAPLLLFPTLTCVSSLFSFFSPLSLLSFLSSHRLSGALTHLDLSASAYPTHRCRFAGRPAPRLTWFLDNEKIDDSYHVDNYSGNVVNELIIPKLNRDYLEPVLSCQAIADAFPLLPPISASIRLDLLCKLKQTCQSRRSVQQ